MTQPFDPQAEAPFTATVKAGKGYEAGWVVVRAASVSALRQAVAELHGSGVLADISNISAEWRAVDALAAGGLQPQQIQSQAATPPPAPPAEYASPNQTPGPPPPWATGGAVDPAQVAVAPPVQAQGAPYAPQGYQSAPPAPPTTGAPLSGGVAGLHPSGFQGPPCPHGPRTWVTGQGKNGRPYYAWDCPAKGSSQACPQDRLWAKKDGTPNAR